jgi:hypothetical protein
MQDDVVEAIARGMALNSLIVRGYVSEKEAPDAIVTAEALADARWHEWTESAQAALSALEASGRVVVPVEMLRPFSIQCIGNNQAMRCIDKTVRQMEPVTVTVTKAQMLALTTAMLAARGDA